MLKVIILVIISINNILIEINCEDNAKYFPETWSEPQEEWGWKPGLDPQSESGPNIDCDNEIYCKCHIRQKFTQEQLDNVKRYLQYRWYYESKAKPLRKPCKQIYVRKSWKCLSDEERAKFVRAFRILYETGVMNAIGELHNRWWAVNHQTGTIDFGAFHIALNLILERELWKIDSTLPGLPYWDYSTEYAQPHKSCMWRDQGWGGLYRNGFCLRNGAIFGNNLKVDFQPRCLKREWNVDGTVAPVIPGEIRTAYIQISNDVREFGFYLGGMHFFIHLPIGGWHGDKGQTIAANDIAFHMSHNDDERIGMLWQLQNSTRLTAAGTPYETFLSIDYYTGELKIESIYDKFVFVNRSRLEFFQRGYGDICYVYDSMVDHIDRIVKGEPPLPPPIAVNRLIKTLSPAMLQKYFPRFAEGRTDFTTNVFDYLPECNTKCRPMPFPQRYNDTGNGRRQNLQNRVAGSIDNYQTIQLSQHYWWNFMMDLNRARYCSPTVNT